MGEGGSCNVFEISSKTRSQEKNAVMAPLLLGMWFADTSASKCFGVNTFLRISNSLQGLLSEDILRLQEVVFATEYDLISARVNTAWRVRMLRMEEADTRYGEKLRIY